MQAQGLVRLMGGAEGVAKAVHQHDTILIAHGLYPAAGQVRCLGVLSTV